MAWRGSAVDGMDDDSLRETDSLFCKGTGETRSKKNPTAAPQNTQMLSALNDDDDESDSGSSLLHEEKETDGTACDSRHRRRRSRRHHHDLCHWNVTEDKTARNKLIAVSGLCFVFMIAEITGGLLANSLAIVSDASHLACDLAGFLVSLFAIWIAKKPPTPKMSFGYYRAEVLGALISVLFIWVITAVLVYLGVKRIVDGEYEVFGQTMLITACVGVAFNILMGIVLHSGIVNCDIQSSFGHGHSHSHGHSHGSHQSHGHSHQDRHGHSHSHSAGQQHVSTQNTSISRNRVHFHQDPNHNSVDGSREYSTAMLFDDNENYHMQALNSSSISNSPSEPRSSSRSTSGNCDDDDILIDAGEDCALSSSPFLSTADFDNENNKRMNLNVRAALIHVIGDLIQSIGVVIAAIVINFKPEYRIADPICTFIFSILVLFTTITILRDILNVVMEAVPKDVDYKQIKADLKKMSGVMTVHSLNVWALSLDRMVVSVHLGIAVPLNKWQEILTAATKLLQQKYGMFQSTIQVELYEETMELCHHCHSD